jgi:hypothetical protein
MPHITVKGSLHIDNYRAPTELTRERGLARCLHHKVIPPQRRFIVGSGPRALCPGGLHKDNQ